MYVVICTAPDGEEHRSPYPMPLSEALEYLAEAAKRMSATGGFLKIEIGPAA